MVEIYLPRMVELMLPNIMKKSYMFLLIDNIYYVLSIYISKNGSKAM